MPSPRSIDDPVRRGRAPQLRRGLYVHFMEARWSSVLAGSAVTFAVINALFAALYTLQPGSIAGAAPGSLVDAFFFSVQTSTTIGYGVMSPATAYANTLVSIEAAIGLFLFALMTGVMFAKASRPRASVLFSQPMVVTPIDGIPTLMFRVGNARGNEVVDASITVSVLMDTVSAEGVQLRKLRDLELVRSRSPMFRLSWVVMHPIDESSPCHGIDWSDPSQSILSVIVALTAHDGTYHQTIYARHMYQPGDIQVGKRFADVITQLDDGRLMIDYDRFHDTEDDGSGRAATGAGA